MKPGTCNKSTETDTKSTQIDDSFTEYLKKHTEEKQQEPPKGKPQEKGNPSRPGQTLKPATLQGSKNPLVRSYLRVPQAAGQVKLWMISNVN